MTAGAGRTGGPSVAGMVALLDRLALVIAMVGFLWVVLTLARDLWR